jgi:hypothetical protein
MKDEEFKLEEIETSLTLGGLGGITRGEGRGEGVDTIGTSIRVYDNRDIACGPTPSPFPLSSLTHNDTVTCTQVHRLSTSITYYDYLREIDVSKCV